MADLADIADSLIEFETSHAMKIFRNKSKKIFVAKKLKYCRDCQELIPSQRRKLGLDLCIYCAEDRERQKYS